jgi:hypothetical protein
MTINDLKIAYDIINNFKKYDTLSNPPRINKLDYKVPCIDGISKYEWGKDIEEVNPNTLQYILYNLHNLDYSKVIDTTIALLYYWKVRKRNILKMEKVYQEILNHYLVVNESTTNNHFLKKENCVYLIEINIGSTTLYKIGKTSDINERFANLKSNIQKMYSTVSVGIKILNLIYNHNNETIEKEILNKIDAKNKKHKFYFNGHTESFLDKCAIDIYNEGIRSLE